MTGKQQIGNRSRYGVAKVYTDRTLSGKRPVIRHAGAAGTRQAFLRAMITRAHATVSLAALLLASACVSDRSPTGVASPDGAGIRLQPALIASPADRSALPVNRVRAVAVAAPGSAVLAETTLEVDPAQSAWTVDLRVPLTSSPTDAIVRLYLVHEASGGVQTVEFSGQTDIVSLVGGQTTEPTDVTLVRGPLANLLVTGVAIADTPLTVIEGQTLALTATAQTSSGSASPLVFWTSLDTTVVRLDGASALGLAPGTVQVIASAGAFADTASVTVLPQTGFDVCSDPSPSSVATFEDENLEGAVRSILGLGPQDPLTCETVSEMATLAATGLGIESLEGVQNLSGLTALFVDDNSISDLSPLSGLTGLTWISVGENQISDLGPLAGLTSLTRLQLSSNVIVDIDPLGTLVSLEDLGLFNNAVQDISAVSALTALDTLDITGNQISDLSPLGELPNLTGLGAHANLITDVGPLSALTTLTTLWLGENSIRDMSPLASLTNLTDLRLYTNELTDISPVSALSNLMFLSVNLNSITNIAPVSDLPNLQVLAFGGNPIQDMSPIEGLTNLTELYAWSTSVSDASALNDLTALTILELQDTQISDISPLAGLLELIFLRLDHMNLNTLQPLLDNPGLGDGDTIDLTNTQGDFSCDDIDTLRSNGATVISLTCPEE